MKVLHSICQQIWKTAVGTGLEKVSFHSSPKERQCQRMLKLLQIALISHATKVMLKILQARLQQNVKQNFQILKLILEKVEKPEIKLPTSPRSLKKQESFRKTSNSALLITPKSLHGSQQTVANSERDGNTRPSYLPPEKPVCRSRSNSYNQIWNKGLVPNWERSTSRLYFVTLLI